MKRSLILTLCSLLSASLFAQHWNINQLSPMPEAVSNNAVCEGFVDGVPYVYSFAGIDESKIYSGIHNRSYRYNTQADTWESIAPLPDTLGKIAASANRIGDIIYIIGGYHVFSNGTELSSNRVHRYNTQTNAYLTDGAPIPIPIDDQVQVVYRDSLIYVITGWSNSQNITDVQIYNPALDEWTSGTPLTFMEVAVFGAAGSILGDTIYFFGGARNGNFAIQSILRKGAINPDDPSEINWSTHSVGIDAYRPAATNAGDNVYLLGGAGQTYNFNGLAYSNGQGVEPSNRSVVYRPTDAFIETDFSNDLPMDLRGIANVSDSIKYLAGGMVANQTVSDQLLKLELIGIPTSNKDLLKKGFVVKLTPNPAVDYLRLELPDHFHTQDIDIQIFDQSGRLVSYLKDQNNWQAIDIQQLPAGMYQLKITNANETGFGRFIKM